MDAARDWLSDADRVLGNTDSADHDVDRVIDGIVKADVSALAGSIGVAEIDPIVLQRVIAVLRARRAALAVDLADVTRERTELARRHRGVAGYTRSST